MPGMQLGMGMGLTLNKGVRLLSLPSGALAVYSVRQVQGYTGPCIRVQRSSDSTQSDIGFKGGLVDLAAAVTFAGGSTLTVATIYDQTGNGNHATQTTNANRPIFSPSISAAVIFDSLNALSASSIYTKFMAIPAGVSYNINASSVFMACRSKSSLWKTAFFSFDQSVAYNDVYLYNDTASYIGGVAAGINNSVGMFSSPNLPAINGSVIGLIGSGTTGTYYCDGVETTYTVSSRTVSSGYIGYLTGFPGFAGEFDLFGMAVYGRALNSTEKAQIASAFNFAASVNTAPYGQIILDGDSITQGYGVTANQGWSKTVAQSYPAYRVLNLAIPGQTAAQVAAAASARGAARYKSGLAKNIAVIWCGTNDIAIGTSAASTYASLKSATQTYKTAGFKTIWATMLPRSDLDAAGQTRWTAYNALIRGATLGQSDTADVLADVQGDATMGPFAACSDTTLYNNYVGDTSVRVHPTDLGCSYLAPYFIAAINAAIAL